MKKRLHLVALLLAGCGRAPQYEDAYKALGSPEAQAREDAVLLAEAQAKEAAPMELGTPPRVHKPGTLALLLYELTDDEGRGRDAFEVRALIPPLPPLPQGPCAAACRDSLLERKAVLLERSGEPGITAEWLMRLPVGRTLMLDRRPLTTQDLFSKTVRQTPIRHVRVTVREACQGQVFAGTRKEFEYFEGWPIPRGIKTQRWVEFSGCEELRARPADERPPVPATDASSMGMMPDNPDSWAALTRDSTVLEACRFDADKHAWEALSVIAPFNPPRSVGLYWARTLRQGTTSQTLIHEGPIPCSQPPAGHVPVDAIAVCVPLEDRVEIRHVPDPAVGCRQAVAAHKEKANPALREVVKGRVLAACRYRDQDVTWEALPLSKPFRLPSEPGLYWLRTLHNGARADGFREIGYGPCQEVLHGSMPPGAVGACAFINGRGQPRQVPDPTKSCVKAFD